jgi:hypothetical protein
MNFNKTVLDKIDNFISLTRNFDLNYKNVIAIQDNEIKNEDIKYIYMITKYYIEIRTLHGELLLLIDELKSSLTLGKLSKQNDNTNKLYDLSTFNSILLNINELITNIDYQYKKIAIKYPKFINKKPLTVLLLTDDDDEENMYVKLINQIKKKNPENIYKIEKCKKSDKKIKCDKILGMGLTLKITSLPLLYIINGSNIVEIPIDKINDSESLSSLLV